VPRRFLPLSVFLFAFLVLMAAQALADKVDDAKKKLKAALDSGDESAAVEAVMELGNCNNAAAVKQLLVLALTTENPKILEAAKESLSACTGEEALTQLLKAVQSKDWRLRALTAGVLGGIDSSRARDAIVGLMSDKKPEVVREAILAAIRQDKAATFVDPLIRLLEREIKEQGLTWVAVRKALIALTGEDYEKPSDWKKAWATIKEETESDRRKKEKPAEKDGNGPGFKTKRKKSPPRFFGAEIYSKRVLFVIDVSSSMKIKEIPFIGESRLELVQMELAKCIKKLDKRARFNVIAFSNRVIPWQKTGPKSSLVPASSKNKRAAIKFVAALSPNGHTYTDEALESAFEESEADTIILLSDGAPYKPKEPREPLSQELMDSILKWVEINNRFRKVIIDTFGFESLAEDKDGKTALEFLKNLAAKTKGSFKGIKTEDW